MPGWAHAGTANRTSQAPAATIRAPARRTAHTVSTDPGRRRTASPPTGSHPRGQLRAGHRPASPRHGPLTASRRKHPSWNPAAFLVVLESADVGRLKPFGALADLELHLFIF